ncbi:hypothetical protein N7466_008349 [Penicillium verhagenii]|uniref:uncharacterized protein n=1 Tax=Penicillium verhagenii TaxID=1562060 RepID=UPI002545905C|nr:uncharacterized protein N7466_008349 [Penicillium verhagenii]KAJ5924162.1 hypothetical protein N7466_008349 [Penicillium verhagenii]
MYAQQDAPMTLAGPNPYYFTYSDENPSSDANHAPNSSQDDRIPQTENYYPQYPPASEPYGMNNLWELQGNPSVNANVFPNGNGVMDQTAANIANIPYYTNMPRAVRPMDFQPDAYFDPSMPGPSSFQVPQRNFFFNQCAPAAQPSMPYEDEPIPTAPMQSYSPDQNFPPNPLSGPIDQYTQAAPPSVPYEQEPMSTAPMQSYSPDQNFAQNPLPGPINSQMFDPALSSGNKYIQSPYSEKTAFLSRNSLQTNRSEQVSSPRAELEWVLVDPTKKDCRREKRTRTQLDIENRKEDIQRLKEFGGACMWCHRSKKKCDPAQVCQPCRSNKRRCIRSSSQLCLIGLSKSPTQENPPIFGPPSKEALDTLFFLTNKTFSDQQIVKVHLSIQHEDKPPIVELTKTHMHPNRPETKILVHEFIHWAANRVQLTDLENFIEPYSAHSLVITAIRTIKLLMIIQNLATTDVQLRASDADLARSTLLLVLIVSFQKLAEVSDRFTAELCEALRQRSTEPTRLEKKDGIQSCLSLGPVIVATDLYFQLVDSLLDLIEIPVVELIFKHLDTHICEAHANLKSILKSAGAHRPKRAKGLKAKKAPGDQLPAFPSTRYFTLIFQVGVVDTNDNSQLTTTNSELISYDVENLFKSVIENLGTSQTPSKEGEKVPVALAEEPAQSASTEKTETDNNPNTMVSGSPSMQSDTFDDILNSLPSDWALDADENMYCGLFEDQ